MEQSLTPAFISAIFTIVLYALTFLSSLFALRLPEANRSSINIYAVTALVIHGFYLYLVIEPTEAANVSVFNMLSLTNFLAMLVLLINSMRRDVILIMMVISSFAIVSTLGSIYYHDGTLIELSGHSAAKFHIVTAMVALGLMTLAAIQAILLIIADRKLRHHPTDIPAYFPPLQGIEQYLFQLLLMGFLLMSTSLVIALGWMLDALASQPLHKPILTGLAWLVFALLIGGHFVRGWRGVQAAKWTLSGFTLLVIGYFGSKLVVEFILHSAQ